MSLKDFRKELIEALRQVKSDVHNWSLTEERVRREENYLIQEAKEKVALDQNRSVEDVQHHLYLSVKKDGDKIGTVEETILPSQDPKKAIDALVKKAHLTSEEYWNFPQPKDSKASPSENYVYPGFKQDLTLGAQTVVDDLRGCITKAEGVEFNSAELFVSLIERHTELSNGFQFSRARSKIYAEVCFSSRQGDQSDEFMVTRMGAQPSDLDLRGLCAESAAGAKALLQAERTPSGTYSVQVDGETLGQIFSDAITHLDAEQKYFQLPFIEKGKTFVEGYSGDAFEVVLDPKMPFGFGSQGYTWDGFPQEPMTLVKNNQVLSNAVSAQMGQYLKLGSTTTVGNLVLKSSGSDMKAWVESGPVLEILQFSALFSSPRDLTFSSEIRLGRLLRPGKAPQYVRGGNFSGRFTENIKGLKLSKQNLVRCLNEESLGYSRSYSGPAFGLLNNVQITS